LDTGEAQHKHKHKSFIVSNKFLALQIYLVIYIVHIGLCLQQGDICYGHMCEWIYWHSGNLCSRFCSLAFPFCCCCCCFCCFGCSFSFWRGLWIFSVPHIHWNRGVGGITLMCGMDTLMAGHQFSCWGAMMMMMMNMMMFVCWFVWPFVFSSAHYQSPSPCPSTSPYPCSPTSWCATISFHLTDTQKLRPRSPHSRIV